LYEETHGIVGNRMYDPLFNATFRPGINEARWWSDGEPIWITSSKNKLKTGCVFFPGTEAPVQGVRPWRSLEYHEEMPFEERVDTIVNWFAQDHIQFGTLYFHEPDAKGHAYGPDSEEVEREVHRMDGVLGYLLESMEDRGLLDTVNIVLTSDHGMTAKELSKVVEIPGLVDWSLIEQFVDNECVCHVFPVDGAEDAVFRALNSSGHRGMSVYRKRDMPSHWHYRHHRRVPPIVIVMDEGWTCTLVSIRCIDASPYCLFPRRTSRRSGWTRRARTATTTAS
jgi:ectonucleotide pyrophosphatase/phosphodiesterase family protein 5